MKHYVIIALLVLLCAQSALAADIGLAVKRTVALDAMHEQPVKTLLESNGHTITLIDKLNVASFDWDSIDLLVIPGLPTADDPLWVSYMQNLPVNTVNTIAIYPDYLDEWHWIDAGSISLVTYSGQSAVYSDEGYGIVDDIPSDADLLTGSGRKLVRVLKSQTSMTPLANLINQNDYGFLYIDPPGGLLRNGLPHSSAIIYSGVPYPGAWTASGQEILLNSVNWMVNGLDQDEDGITDGDDNCPTVYNPEQEDTDSDGVGDACDVCINDPENDADEDGICGDVDNCPSDSNPDQTDSDDDGMGDACDTCPNDPENDSDDDGVCGDIDNCPDTSNPSQTDTDNDDIGDACDLCPNDPQNDIDQDGICGDVDNCPYVYNPSQQDTDGDGVGTACDSDEDMNPPTVTLILPENNQVNYTLGTTLFFNYYYTPTDLEAPMLQCQLYWNKKSFGNPNGYFVSVGNPVQIASGATGFFLPSPFTRSYGLSQTILWNVRCTDGVNQAFAPSNYTLTVNFVDGECLTDAQCTGVTECDQMDACVGPDYYDYTDQPETCVAYMCEGTACSDPVISYNDPRCGCTINEDCDDGISCTMDTCGDDDLCVNEPVHSLCDDTLYCNGQESCDILEGCVNGAAPALDDGVICTIDSCDEELDSVTHSASDALCDNGLFCDGVETCDQVLDCQIGTAVDCSAYGVGTCTNDPDNNPFTYDYYLSTCDESTDSCTQDAPAMTHECDIDNCGAECITDTDCGSVCSLQDGCYDGMYRDYLDVPSTCSACECAAVECTQYIQLQTDGDEDGADIECELDCDDNNPAVYPGALEICDGVDNNCIDGADEGFPDNDADDLADCVDSDDDNDGLPDTIELDMTDGFSTDPFNADSDGEGLLDGAEDANVNGQVDEGETDPNNADTDGDTYSDLIDLFPLDATEWTDLDSDGTGDNSDPDMDGDGTLNEDDTIIGNHLQISVTINGNTAASGLSVNGTVDPATFTDDGEVTISGDGVPIVTFVHGFESILDLRGISIQMSNDGTGSLIISGITLAEGETKSAYLPDVSTSSTVCVFDEEVVTLSVEGDCANGIKLTCPGTNGAYECTATLGAPYTISGLRHSGVTEYSYTAPVVNNPGGGGGSSRRTTPTPTPVPSFDFLSAFFDSQCVPDWQCGSWNSCQASGTQTRTCQDMHQCGTLTGKPVEQQACTIASVTEVTTEPAGSVATEEQIEPTATPEEPETPGITGAVIGGFQKHAIAWLIVVAALIGILVGVRFYVKKPKKDRSK